MTQVLPIPPTVAFDRRRESDHEKRLSTVEQAHAGVEKSLGSVIVKLDLILIQVNKVALLEERHSNQQIEINRAYDRLQKMEGKHEVFSEEVRAFINVVKGMAKMSWVLWGVLGGTVAGLVTKIVFLPPHAVPL